MGVRMGVWAPWAGRVNPAVHLLYPGCPHPDVGSTSLEAMGGQAGRKKSPPPHTHHRLPGPVGAAGRDRRAVGIT